MIDHDDDTNDDDTNDEDADRLINAEGQPVHVLRDGAQALENTFGHDAWESLTLLQQLAVLADFLPATVNDGYEDAEAAARGVRSYLFQTGELSLAAWADHLLLRVARASEAAGILNQLARMGAARLNGNQ